MIRQNQLVSLSIHVRAGLVIKTCTLRYLSPRIVSQGLPSNRVILAALSDRREVSIVQRPQTLGPVGIGTEPRRKSIPGPRVLRIVIVLKGYDIRKRSEIASKQNHCELVVSVWTTKLRIAGGISALNSKVRPRSEIASIGGAKRSGTIRAYAFNRVHVGPMPSKHNLSVIANTSLRLLAHAVEISKATTKVSILQGVRSSRLEMCWGSRNTLGLPNNVAAEGCLTSSSDHRNARQLEASRWLPDMIEIKTMEG